MPRGVPLTEKQQELRRQEICEAALPLFFEKGFNETSMREVAAAAGIGKSTLYDYFMSKEEILVLYFEHEVQEVTRQAMQIAVQDLSVTDKLSRIMHAHMEQLVDNKNFYLRLTAEAQRISADGQKKIQLRRHAYQDLLSTLIEEGVRKGEFRSVNPLFVARNINLLLANAVFTTRPSGTPEEMLEQAETILFHGILP